MTTAPDAAPVMVPEAASVTAPTPALADDPLWQRVERICTVLALTGATLMLVCAVLVTVSVAKRWFTTSGIDGDFELVEMALALTAFSFFPLCQLHGHNIFVDTFTARAPAWLQAGLDGLWSLLYALIALLIAWRMTIGTLDTFASGTTTMVLELRFGWAMALATLAAFWLACTALLTALRFFRRPA